MASGSLLFCVTQAERAAAVVAVVVAVPAPARARAPDGGEPPVRLRGIGSTRPPRAGTGPVAPPAPRGDGRARSWDAAPCASSSTRPGCRTRARSRIRQTHRRGRRRTVPSWRALPARLLTTIRRAARSLTLPSRAPPRWRRTSRRRIAPDVPGGRRFQTGFREGGAGTGGTMVQPRNETAWRDSVGRRSRELHDPAGVHGQRREAGEQGAAIDLGVCDGAEPAHARGTQEAAVRRP